MAYSKETRAEVRANYIKGMTLKAAAIAANVPYETARGWKRKALDAGDDWDMQRAARSVSQSGVSALTAEVIEDFVLMFKATIDEVKTAENIKPVQKAQLISQLSDAYSKTVKAAGDSSPQLSRLAVAMDVLKMQADFIRKNYPDLFTEFAEMINEFGSILGKEFA